jgi:3-deoxy-D-manno-octulosonic-acid transferase
VFLAGSTQAPEESIVLQAFLELSDRFPNLNLILVPRHAERFEEVAKLIASTGLPWARRSTSQSDVTPSNWRIFLGDSVGELRWWWGLAQIGFVGGSFGERGGQNMIEPCAYGVATCFGPNTRNFSDIVKLLLEESSCEQLKTAEELKPWVESMLSDSARREAMSQRAMEVCQRHRGASQRTWDHLQRLLPTRPITKP